jgi:hypothetical protein
VAANSLEALAAAVQLLSAWIDKVHALHVFNKHAGCQMSASRHQQDTLAISSHVVQLLLEARP